MQGFYLQTTKTDQTAWKYRLMSFCWVQIRRYFFSPSRPNYLYDKEMVCMLEHDLCNFCFLTVLICMKYLYLLNANRNAKVPSISCDFDRKKTDNFMKMQILVIF